MTTQRTLSFAALTALGLLVLAPEARSLAGDRGRGSQGGGGGQSAPVSRPAPSHGDGGGSRPAPVSRPAPSAPPVQHERPVAPAPRYDPPARREAPAQPPVRSEPRSAPAFDPTPDRGQVEHRTTPRIVPTTPDTGGSSRVPTRRDDSARTAPAPRREAPPQSTPWVGSGSTGNSREDASGAPSPSTRRVFDGSPVDGGRRSESPRVPPGGTSGGRLDRVYDSTRSIDLSGVGVAPRASFPVPSGSAGAVRPGLGSRRADALERGSDAGLRRTEGPSARRGTPVVLDTPIGAGLDHGSLRDRYEKRGTLGQPGDARRRDGLANAADVSKEGEPRALDGARRKAGLEAAGTPGARVLDGTRRKDALDSRSSTLDGRRRKEALDTDGATARAFDGTLRKERLGSQQGGATDDHERRVRAARVAAVQQQKLDHLADLRNRRRSEYQRVVHTGNHVARAANTGIAVALGTTFGACTGSMPGWFWDPCGPTGHFECNSWTNWGTTWWWNSSAWAWPCSSWAFGYTSHHWNFWWSSSCGAPWWAYRWCPYPAYYSAIVYDTYDPAPVIVYREPVIIVQDAPRAEPEPEAAPEPVPAGERVLRPGDGVVPVPAKPAQDANANGQASTVYLDKGDAAWRDGRYADAVHFYAKAVEAAPDEAVLHLILADALFATGDYHYAAYSLKKALELDATLLDTTLDKRNLYPDPREFDRQLGVLEQYVADHPVDDDARLLLAANYLLAKRPAQSADVLQSPYAVALRENATGKLVLDKANEQRERR